MAFGDGLALLFTLKAKDEASGVVKGVRGDIDREVKGMEAVFQRLGNSVGLTNTQVSSLSRSLPVAGAAIGGVVATATAAGVALFSMAKEASDAGSAIVDLKAKTGLGAESLSALKFAADQSGSSVQEAAQAFVIYQNKLTDAAAKGKDLFGIDARRALSDQEYALRALTQLLNGPLPAGFSRSSLAAELMGRSGSNLLATFDAIGPSFDKFLDQAKRMGVVLTEEDVKAADEFGDSLTVLQTIMGATSNKMALQFAPEMTKGMNAVGEMVSRNKDIIVGAFQAIGAIIEQQVTLLRGWTTAFVALKNSVGGMSIADSIAGAIVGGGPGVVSQSAAGGGGAGALTGNLIDPEVLAKVKADADKLAREAKRLMDAAIKEAIQKEEQARRARFQALQAEHDHELNMLEERGKRIVALIERQEEQKTITHARAARLRLTVEQNELLAQQRQAEAQLKKARDEKLEAATIKLMERRVELLKEEAATFQALADIQTTKAAREDSIEVQAKKIGQLEAMADAMERMADASARIGAVGPLPPGPVAGPQLDNLGRPVGPGNILSPEQLGALGPDLKPPDLSIWEQMARVAKGATGEVVAQGQIMHDAMTGAFASIGQAFGKMVGALAAGEKVSGKVFLAMAKSSLIGIAIESAARAAFHAAMGLAYLILNPALAANQFAAAKAFIVSAAVAGALGAAIPSGGASGGGGYAGAAYASGSSGNEDYRESRRSQYERERTEADRSTRRETRREETTRFEVPINLDGREIARAVINVVREGGDERNYLKGALA